MKPEYKENKLKKKGNPIKMNETITTRLVSHILSYQNFATQSEILHSVKRCLLDYCGVVLAGAKETEKYIGKTNYKSEAVSAFGFSMKTDVFSAAFINGFSAHKLELDDGHRFGMLHLGAPIISAVLAVVEDKQIYDGLKIMKSIALGYEGAIILAKAVQPEHKLNGFHATGTCGTVGAAIGVAVLLDYDEEKLRNTLAAASSSAAGILELIDNQSEMKPYNIGRAAVDGVVAAYFAGWNITGPIDPIGGERGFLSVMRNDKISSIDLGENWKITEIYTKPYAACRHCHSPIEAVLRIRDKILDSGKKDVASEINKIEVQTYLLAIKGHDHKRIEGESSAKMSIPYSVSVALLTGKAGQDVYAEKYLRDKQVQSIMAKTDISENQQISAQCPQKRGAVVSVYLKDGSVYSEQVEYPLGEPENPMSDRQMEQKARSLMLYAEKKSTEIDKIIQTVWRFEEKPQLLCELLQ